MAEIGEMALTIPEAAFVTGLSVRTINHEIDEQIIRPAQSSGVRKLLGSDILYLGAVRAVRTHMGQKLRRRLRDAIAEASDAKRDQARIDHFTLALPEVEEQLAAALQTLEMVKRDQVESRSDVLAGEPVLKGTRIPARHVADLVRLGAGRDEIKEDLDLTETQIEAAIVFDRVTPRVGRPAARRAFLVDVPPPR